MSIRSAIRSFFEALAGGNAQPTGGGQSRPGVGWIPIGTSPETGNFLWVDGQGSHSSGDRGRNVNQTRKPGGP
jgi:hypothetical protein